MRCLALVACALRVVGILVAGILAALAAGPAMAQHPVVTIEVAQARLEPQGLAPVEERLDLVSRWDRRFPGRDGRATYRIDLPPHTGDEPMAVLFSRVGNQVLVRLDGVTVQRWGVLGDPAYDASKTPRMIVFPASLLHGDRVNELSVEVTIQQQRWGGMSVLRYGPQAVIEPLYEAQRRWTHSALVVLGMSLAGMGALSAALWWRQREPLYGWFSLAALLGTVRDLDRVWSDLPVPWPVWGAVEAVCYATHLALICRFTMMALGPVGRSMDRAVDGVVLLASTLAIAAFMLHVPVLWTLALGSLVPLGILSIATVARMAVRSGNRSAWLLVGMGGLVVTAGVYDFSQIRVMQSSGFRIQLTPMAMFVFVLVMGALVVERYSRSVADYRALNADLSKRIAEREQQLRIAFDSLREQQTRESVAIERQRIMREIHDGVGSQLVGLLHMVGRHDTDPDELKQHVVQALDEMRMAVDSLQPTQDDLVTVLATLRYRLQPRLQAAGVAVVWDVVELPALRQLTPHAVLQVQRILMEAFTNVLKHAHASSVLVQTRWVAGDPPSVVLRITDDGVGLPRHDDRSMREGKGLANMQARASGMGASLRLEQAATGGVCLVLEWPVVQLPPTDP